jgi:plasmid stability protein
MAAVTVRNLPEETHRALKQRAKAHGQSTEAEIREILQAAVAPKVGLKVGTTLAELGRRHGGLDDVKMERSNDLPEPAEFE